MSLQLESRSDLVRTPPPRWAVLAACAVPLGTSLAEQVYVSSLSVVSVGLGLLTLGPVQPWGEVAPRWVPGLGGRRVPVAAAVVPAVAGATTVSLLCAYAVLNAHFHWVTQVKPTIGEERSGPGITRTALEVGTWAYSPLVLWGPLLLAVTLSYLRRRRVEG